MRIVLASAQFDLRLALEILLREEPGTDIVGTASEAASVKSLLQSCRPDLVLLDWDLPGNHTPIQLLAEARTLRPRPQVIVLGRDEAVRQEALAAGTDAFVSSGDLPCDLMDAIRQSRARHRNDSGSSQATARGPVFDGTKEP